MDFFESQHQARRQTGRLVLLFALAVVAIGCTLYAVAVAASGYQGVDPRTGGIRFELVWLDRELMATVALATLTVVGGGSLYKIAQLRSGGGRFVAESLGGRLLHGDSADPVERRILNVVEELAIASGTTVPPVYLLDREPGINAFAAGFSPADAVVAITRGTAVELTRDELQGVLAHEFSHILNGDMRLNIRLMGVLHGILIIGLIGYFLFRSSLYASHGRRSERGNAGMLLVAVGAALAVTGFLGTFIGNLIKATVSRQREYLADASAVQFTRNPSGIAGALKKIGGFEPGSALESPNAPEASHAYFANGLSAGLTSLFATHPPLAERIRRLDPSFLSESARRSTAERGASATAAAFAGGVRSRGVEAVAQIGNSSPAHVAYAANLRDSLPARVLEAARDPYGARALIYALLCSPDGAVRARQLAQLAPCVDAPVLRETRALRAALDGVARGVELPLVDLSLPALQQLTQDQYLAFRDAISLLSNADDRIDLFEWTLQRVLLAHLAPRFEAPVRKRIRFSGLRGLRAQLSVVLSTLAQVHPEDSRRVEAAFARGAASLEVEGLTLLPREQCGLAALDRALLDLADAKPRLERKIVTACAEVVLADARVTLAETELLRAVADSLGCPMPPLLADPVA